MGVKITVVVDNHGGERLSVEHGLSLWIEHGGKHLLFDTGQGGALKRNAEALGIDLRTTDSLVISHGHYDHSGGAAALLRMAPQAHVYCHRGVLQARYAVEEGGSRSIGIPREASEALERLPPERLHWIDRPTTLQEGVGITGPIPRGTDFEDTGGPFFLDPEGRHPDPIEDDLALWIRDGDGLVVCVGCSHAGIVNTLNRVRELNDGLPIRAVIGGFHLLNADEERLKKTIVALERLGLEHLIPCHCTGELATTVLRGAFGARQRDGAVGVLFRR